LPGFIKYRLFLLFNDVLLTAEVCGRIKLEGPHLEWSVPWVKPWKTKVGSSYELRTVYLSNTNSGNYLQNCRYVVWKKKEENHANHWSRYPASWPRFEPETYWIQSRSCKNYTAKFYLNWLSGLNSSAVSFKLSIYLFTYSLFNDAFSSSHFIASNERIIVNNELERMWKEAVVA
jgi:hypothetical protein